MGRLTREPETKQAQNGNWYCVLSVAVNHGKNQQGEEETTFVELSAFNKTGELISKLNKGARVCVAADLKLEQWTSQQTGKSGATLRGTVRSVDIIDWPEQQAAAPQAGYGIPAPGGYQQPAPTPQYQQPAYGAPAPVQQYQQAPPVQQYQQPPTQQPPAPQQTYQQPAPPVAGGTPWGK